MERPKHEGEPATVPELATQVAAGTVDAIRRDVAPLADEMKREAHEASREAAALAAVAVLGMLGLHLAVLGITDALARHTKRSTAAFAVSGALALGAAAAAAYARRNRPVAPGRRLLERVAAALRSSRA
jgi:hypothetical protein